MDAKREQVMRVPRNYLTTIQVAHIFGVSAVTVGNWARWGLLPTLQNKRGGPHYINPAILPTFEPPRTSPAWFNREAYDAIVREHNG